MSLKLEGESNDTTLPVETPCVNVVNESQLIPQTAPMSSPATGTSKTTLPNIVGTTVSVPPATNKAKSEISNGTQSPTEQPDADNPVTSVDNNQYDKPTSNTENNGEPSTPEIMETDIDKTGQHQLNKTDKREVISEPIEQLTLSHNTTNKDPVNHEQDVPITNHATPIRMCTVHLEILTEADIVKHVHVHKDLKSKTVPPTKPGEAVGTVETVETVHLTRSCTKRKPPRTNRLPRTASNNIAYVHQDDQSDSGSSPSAKRKRNLRPKKELSSTRIKAVSFSTKSPSV